MRPIDRNATASIIDLVREGRITPRQGAILLELRHDLERARRRKAFWRGVLDGLTLGPLWRWIMRRLRR